MIPLHPELHLEVAQIRDSAANSIQRTEFALILATRPQPKSNDDTGLRQLITDQNQALRQIRNLSRDPEKANLLVKLAPHLHSELVLEAQSVAQEITNPYHQARSLLALATHFPDVRADARTQISKLQDKDLIQYIELFSQFAITVPEEIPTLLKAVEEWAKKYPFKADLNEDDSIENGSSEGDANEDDSSEDDSNQGVASKDDANQESGYKPDPNAFKRCRILIALKPHLPIRLVQEINRETGIGRAPQDLWERALFVLRTEYRQALKSGSLRNDATQEQDLLNLKDEINALTEMLLMRDLEPPVAVGILGGWGGGKSYVMHLMQSHMVTIRSQGLDKVEAWGLREESHTRNTPDSDRVGRFVGHIYQIKFDAWTYTKGSLWASLMQTIFYELDRQISLEKALEEIGINPLERDSSEIWRVLYQSNEDDRKYILEKALGQGKLAQLQEKSEHPNESWTELLWEQYGATETHARERLTTAEEELNKVTSLLKEEEKKKTAINEQLTHNSKQKGWQNVLEEANNISGFLLTKYFGKNIESALKKEIEDKLESENIDTSDLSQTIQFINKTFNEILEQDQVILSDGSKKYSLSWLALRRWATKNRQLIITVLILLSCAIVGPFIVHWKNPTNIVAQLSLLVTPLIPAISFIQTLLKSNQKWFVQAKQSVQEYQKTLEQKSKDNVLISEETANELRQLEREMNHLRDQQKSWEQQITQAKQDLPPDAFASLADFVSATVKGERYDRELGIMHQVKTDLSKLSQALLPPPHDSEEYKHKLEKLQKVFPRGPARVVLYIDDLDRCPPNTVVDVLEAVQLLIKNPLFIAVLAIDERYINRALAHHYKGVLSLQGRPSAADYLEKIIQIPYRIRPIAADALRKYLRAQVVVQDSQTSGSKFNEFSPQEFELLLKCCQEVELSPRSLKRLTNVYKLYKILSRTRGHRPTPREQSAILVLLTFSNRYPDLMRDIIEAIASHYEEGKHLRDEDTETLASAINTYLTQYKDHNPNSILIQDAEKLRHDVKKLLEDDPKLGEIRQVFDFVRSFSFVGDIGTNYTPFS